MQASKPVHTLCCSGRDGLVEMATMVRMERTDLSEQMERRHNMHFVYCIAVYLHTKHRESKVRRDLLERKV